MPFLSGHFFHLFNFCAVSLGGGKGGRYWVLLLLRISILDGATVQAKEGRKRERERAMNAKRDTSKYRGGGGGLITICSGRGRGKGQTEISFYVKRSFKEEEATGRRKDVTE